METQTALVFTRLGLFLDFLAFFLAAPEILGETGMLKAREFIRVLLVTSSMLLFGISAIAAIMLLFFWLVVPIVTMASSVAVLAQFTDQEIPAQVFIEYYLLIGVVGGLLSWIPTKLMKVMDWLTNDVRFRRQLLNIGVLSFVLGSLAQLAGTF